MVKGMRKRILLGALCVLLLLSLCGCGPDIGAIGGADGPTAVMVSSGKPLFRRGNVKHTVVESPASDIYTEAELDAVIAAAMDYFRDYFGGCTLESIAYLGDERSAGYAEDAARYGVDEIAVLTSSFSVGKHGGDGSLTPGGHYDNWLWIMGRKDGGDWKHLDHGY